MTGVLQQRREVEATPGVVRVEAWSEFEWLRAGFSTRQGGGSVAYGAGEQNLGWTGEDDTATVAENRRRFVAEVSGEREVALVTVRQLHGGVVQVVRRGGAALETAEGKAVLQGDGLITGERGLMLGIQTADCVPVLVADTRKRVVGGFHAGWKGTLAGIAGVGVEAMVREFGARPEDFVAAIGPSIGPCCFAVGEEVRRQFEERFGDAGELFAVGDGGQIFGDLWEANRRQLVEAGVRAEAITVVGECSACARLEDGRRRYFSYRAERGVTGRMMSVIGVVEG
ncbi:MAG: peptidoglycan editing factor PgeF [Acidobacteria bacterium]|nr:peptidoglycan editing factor PgeF [Acidobacteriota bacterium]